MTRRGFVLVEAVAAVIIMSICLTWIMQALMGNMSTASIAQDKSRALLILQNHMEEILFKSASQEIPCRDMMGQTKEEKRFDVDVQCQPLDTEKNQKVHVRVRWPSGPNTREVSASTIVYEK